MAQEQKNCQQFFSLFDWLLRKVNKIPLAKKLTDRQLKIELLKACFSAPVSCQLRDIIAGFQCHTIQNRSK